MKEIKNHIIISENNKTKKESNLFEKLIEFGKKDTIHAIIAGIAIVLLFKLIILIALLIFYIVILTIYGIGFYFFDLV